MRNWIRQRRTRQGEGMAAPSQFKGLRGAVPRYVAQAIPQIDAEIAEKCHLWMETSYLPFLLSLSRRAFSLAVCTMVKVTK
jgi:hypothetical protein